MEVSLAQQALLSMALLGFGVGARFDLKNKALPVSFLAAAFLIGSAAAALLREDFPLGYLLSLLPGLFLLSLVPVTRGGIGAGDGLLLLSAGALLSLENVLFVLLAGLMLASVYAAFLFLRHRRKNESFPLVPFFLGGYLLLLVTGAF